MARELEIKGHKYWILSETDGARWRSKVVEVRQGGGTDDMGGTEDMGIDASAETRSAADDAAERKLRRLLRAY